MFIADVVIGSPCRKDGCATWLQRSFAPSTSTRTKRTTCRSQSKPMSMLLGKSFGPTRERSCNSMYTCSTVWHELLFGCYPFTGQASEVIIWQIGRGIKQVLNFHQASKEVKASCCCRRCSQSIETIMLIYWCFGTGTALPLLVLRARQATRLSRVVRSNSKATKEASPTQSFAPDALAADTRTTLLISSFWFPTPVIDHLRDLCPSPNYRSVTILL